MLIAGSLPADPADVVPAADRHRWIAGHWVRALAAEGWAEVDGNGLLRSVRSPRRAELAAAREAITGSVAGLGHPRALATYVLDPLRDPADSRDAGSPWSSTT
ncbi:hypothetical protein [Saccharothrix sp. Mg75]|uniref:hypothetical protein n=1 Tax=Saccharothrix sp. Mg75 TaxID=3445357 RepID=UPI003EECB38B